MLNLARSTRPTCALAPVALVSVNNIGIASVAPFASNVDHFQGSFKETNMSVAANFLNKLGDRDGRDIVPVSATGRTYDATLAGRSAKNANERATLAWNSIELALSRAYVNGNETAQLFDNCVTAQRVRHALFVDLHAPSTAAKKTPCDRRGFQAALADVQAWLVSPARDKTQVAHDAFLSHAREVYMSHACVEREPRAVRTPAAREAAALERSIVTVCNALGVAGGMSDADRARIVAALQQRMQRAADSVAAVVHGEAVAA